MPKLIQGKKRKSASVKDGSGSTTATATTTTTGNDYENDDDDDDTGALPSQQQRELQPITSEGTMPQKKFYRSRAHCNPLSFNEAFDYPTCPELMDWTEDHYPNHPLLTTKKQHHPNNTAKEDCVESTSPSFLSSSSSTTVNIQPNVLDIGCGFGGLTLALSNALPNHTILGLEIRTKVTEYVRLRILAHRKEQQQPNLYQNCSVLRTNAMKYLPNFFKKASIEKIFFCFPDPHFKRKNHPRRIISERLLSEYAYLLTPNVGRLYCITDVKDLHLWHVEKCGNHPLLRELTEEEMEEDVCVKLMKSETEEGKKVIRDGKFGHEMYYRVYRRVGAEEEGGNDKKEKKKQEEEEDSTTTSRTKDGKGEVGTKTDIAETFFMEGQFGVEVIKYDGM